MAQSYWAIIIIIRLLLSLVSEAISIQAHAPTEIAMKRAEPAMKSSSRAGSRRAQSRGGKRCSKKATQLIIIINQTQTKQTYNGTCKTNIQTENEERPHTEIHIFQQAQNEILGSDGSLSNSKVESEHVRSKVCKSQKFAKVKSCESQAPRTRLVPAFKNAVRLKKAKKTNALVSKN